MKEWNGGCQGMRGGRNEELRIKRNKVKVDKMNKF